MAYKIITNPEANRDIVNSFEYYKNVAGKKVANSFFKDFKFTVNKLQKVAYFQKIHNDFHRLPLRVFPFIIIYKIEKQIETIKIFRVFHTSQNPEKYP
ncbi:type II toxin-antitoxin system RelE/ParE family toxin [Chryseobacterium indoltheticum]|uniref:ParE toxin of type II toxin-antitoxin system, parDE n=1 Tax=Chryseobacterium indoltheticum TaxID=254 RepID=A0A381FEI9_9FLAO|nr:type II toxin-antitoxin system RelE/ParE family toxin [Chryseobacterium indoltheticum]AZA74218.1 type II toxin-antitoxin system RelE/ParE family toxin [Chryseobacterium indoltheticum]QQQ29354.1 type II toxin-antitoxin system RelE/ParE family toxin [Chryseobacterium indoltheticum]SIQ16423.1 ParE toxin of type II toxin-antitoxin system, parDE [Chryseobacterium indoltheticum]SUX44572.1 Plasmid stabilisation system protein [Chryseobacterium indoltheticum]SUX44937.1 Plasmid stabilisation system 